MSKRMTAAFVALIISALPRPTLAPSTEPVLAPTQVFDAFVATEETPEAKALFQPAIFHQDHPGRAIVTPTQTSSIV